MIVNTSPPLTEIPLLPVTSVSFLLISDKTALSFAPPRPSASLRAASSSSSELDEDDDDPSAAGSSAVASSRMR